MPFEKPQDGNPHKFVIKQHFHTAHCIGKFHNIDGKVEVKFLKTGKVEKKGKRSGIFCAKRNWDENAERGLMAEIEKEFHDEVNNIKSFQKRNHKAISKYFLLWRIRHHFYTSPLEDATLNGITGSGLSKEQEESVERVGAVFVRDEGKVPSRFLTGVQIQLILDQQWSAIESLKWGLLEAKEGEFIVSDCFQDLTLIPISPKLAFCGNHKDMIIDHASVAGINNHSIQKATNFYFARDLTKCPVA